MSDPVCRHCGFAADVHASHCPALLDALEDVQRLPSEPHQPPDIDEDHLFAPLRRAVGGAAAGASIFFE